MLLIKSILIFLFSLLTGWFDIGTVAGYSDQTQIQTDDTASCDATEQPIPYVYSAKGKNGSVWLTYNAQGRLLTYIVADRSRGTTTTRAYDALNRVTATTHPDGLEPISYSYDASGAGNFGIGRLAGFTDGSGSTSFTYDELGDILTDTRVIGVVSYTTTYTYNLAGRIMNITYPSGHKATYTRDQDGRITAIRWTGVPSATLANNVAYNPLGPIAGFTYGNGLTEALAYDQDYRLTAINTSGTNPIQNLAFVYDNASDITSITDNLDNTRNQTLTYDADYRLLSGVGKYGTDSYTYDADGNRLTGNEGGVASTFSYPTTSNQLSQVVAGGKTRKLTYNAAGDMTADNRAASPNAKFTYSKLNQLETSTITGGAVATYLYNALGERALKDY